MELKVNHKGLNSVAKETHNNAELLDAEIDKLVDSTNELKDIWQGNDSEKYCDRVYSYLKDLRIVPELYRTFGAFIGNADKTYVDINDEYSTELENVVKYNE